MQRLRNLILSIIRCSSRPLSRTEIMKLVYLFECEEVRIHGRQYSEAAFVREKYGPFSPAVLNVLDSLQSTGVLACTCHEIDTDCVLYEYRIAEERHACAFDIPERERQLACRLVDQMRSLTLREIRDVAYATDPMAAVLAAEEQAGRALLGKELDMTTIKRPQRFTEEELAAARQRLAASEDRGFDDDYAEAIAEVYEEFEELRRRAASCLISR